MFLLRLIFLTFTILIFNNLSHAKENETEIKLVHVFFRHGSRTPESYEVYPNDPLSVDKFRPTGFGQLTKNGKKQSYRLGEILRKRYKGFLGDSYNPDTIKIRTTDLDRTKMTALLVSAALFSPSASDRFEDDLNWQPIPYHYEKKPLDHEFATISDVCPAFKKEFERVLSSDEVQNLMKKHSKTFDYVSQHTTLKIDTLPKIYEFYQALSAEDVMNLTLPEWTHSIYPDPLYYLASMNYYYKVSNNLLRKLGGGRVLKGVVQNMLSKSKGDMEKKMFLYSCHDENILHILGALDLFTPHVPNYSSSVIIELHKEIISKRYIVKVFYVRNIDSGDVDELVVKGCGVPCVLQEFVEVLRPIVSFNFKEDCEDNFG